MWAVTGFEVSRESTVVALGPVPEGIIVAGFASS